MGTVGGVNPAETQSEIRDKISSSPLWHLRPSKMHAYRLALTGKKLNGQPISLTDFVGLFVGDHLLREVTTGVPRIAAKYVYVNRLKVKKFVQKVEHLYYEIM